MDEPQKEEKKAQAEEAPGSSPHSQEEDSTKEPHSFSHFWGEKPVRFKVVENKFQKHNMDDDWMKGIQELLNWVDEGYLMNPKDRVRMRDGTNDTLGSSFKLSFDIDLGDVEGIHGDPDDSNQENSAETSDENTRDTGNEPTSDQTSEDLTQHKNSTQTSEGGTENKSSQKTEAGNPRESPFKVFDVETDLSKILPDEKYRELISKGVKLYCDVMMEARNAETLVNLGEPSPPSSRPQPQRGSPHEDFLCQFYVGTPSEKTRGAFEDLVTAAFGDEAKPFECSTAKQNTKPSREVNLEDADEVEAESRRQEEAKKHFTFNLL